MATEVASAINAYKTAVQNLKATPGNSDGGPQATGFADMVKSMAQGAIDVQKTAEIQTAAAAAGKADLNQVVIAVAEAETTLKTVVAVRNKVIEAYRQIMRMPI